MTVVNIIDVKKMRFKAASQAKRMHSKMLKECGSPYLHQFIKENNLDKSLEDVLFQGMLKRSQNHEE